MPGRFDEKRLAAIALIAEHRPLEEILTTVSALIESAHNGALCAVAVRLDDHRLGLYGSSTATTHLGAVVSEELAVDFARLDQTSIAAGIVEIEDTARSPSHRVWYLPFIGLGARPLGALCVSHDSAADNARLDEAFRHAAYLAQIAVEQDTAARNFAGSIAAEREQLANQIHDDPIQSITMVSLALQRLARDAPPETLTLIDDTRTKVGDTIERMRRMLFELHPTALEDDGLAVAIEIYLEEVVEPLGVEWTVDDLSVRPIDDAISSLAFRLVHEALANAAKHSDAKRIDIVLSETDRQLHISIVDDGKGFDPASVPRFRPGHLGLSNVRYIARRAAGTFDVTSSPGNGCRIDITLPTRDPDVAPQSPSRKED